VAGRRTNAALGVLLAVALVTGVGMFAVGSGWNTWWTVAHGIAGVAVVALAPWKSLIVHRGLHRRGLGASLLSLALAGALIVGLATGFAHALGLRQLDGLTAVQIHVGAAVVIVVLGIAHVAARPQRVRRADLSRRTALRAGALAAGAAAGWGVVKIVGADRRGTGSIEVGTDDPSAMPVTQWLFDEVPAIDLDGWRLDVAGRQWSYAELLTAGGDDGELRAVLDCTGGWWASQEWSGVRLDHLLGANRDRAVSIEIRSITGYARRFPATDASRLWLATAVGGEPLSPGHGSPARLVAPGRRGFWWVKWVTSIRPSDRPWWLQSPFPLT
jgi:DMSO/TMAO reductase YedYZ molybdopterin-dependent catalytic subunit